MASWVRPDQAAKTGSLLDLPRAAYPDGCERLSEQIDMIVYGT